MGYVEKAGGLRGTGHIIKACSFRRYYGFGAANLKEIDSRLPTGWFLRLLLIVLNCVRTRRGWDIWDFRVT